jgi:hypothetical protein
VGFLYLHHLYEQFMNDLFLPYTPTCLIVWGEERRLKLNHMSTQEVFVQQFTKLFQHYSSALSSTEQEAAPAWSNPELADESNRLVAAARLAILELETNASLHASDRRYFAKPGEAEWGC